MMKVVTALLVAPLFPAVVAALLVGTLRNVEFNAENASVAAFGCLLGGYLAALFIGFPLSFVWKHFRWTKVMGGITLGMVSAFGVTLVAALLLRPMRHSEVSLLTGLMNLLTFTLPLGCVGGLAFWWFVRDRRGRSIPESPPADTT